MVKISRRFSKPYDVKHDNLFDEAATLPPGRFINFTIYSEIRLQYWFGPND